MPGCMYVCQYVCQSVSMSVNLSVSLSVCLSGCLHVWLSAYLQSPLTVSGRARAGFREARLFGSWHPSRDRNWNPS